MLLELLFVTSDFHGHRSTSGKTGPSRGSLQLVFVWGFLFSFFALLEQVLFKVKVELLPLKSKFILLPSEGS